MAVSFADQVFLNVTRIGVSMLSISRALVAAAQVTSRTLTESVYLADIRECLGAPHPLVQAEFIGLDIASLQSAQPLGSFRLRDGTCVVRDICSGYSLSAAWWEFAGMVGRASWSSRTLGYASVGALDHAGLDRDIRAVAGFAGLDAPSSSGKQLPSAAADPWGLPHTVHPLAQKGRAGLVRRVLTGGFGTN